MAFLNIRLGMWVKNPGKWEKENQMWNKRTLTPPNLIRPGLNSLFRLFGFREKSSWVELTDGGHFENLGIYELIRRRCKLIIACDAGSDPDFKFSDLGNAVERVRADFGVLINLDGKALRKLVPTKSDKSTPEEVPADAPLPFLIANIIFQQMESELIRLVVIKAFLFTSKLRSTKLYQVQMYTHTKGFIKLFLIKPQQINFLMRNSSRHTGKQVSKLQMNFVWK